MVQSFKNDRYPVLLALVLFIQISGCSLIDNDNKEDPGDLLRAWELIAITDEEGNDIELFEGEVHTARFSRDGSLGGETACNSFGGEFKAERDGDIRISNLLTTDEACQEPNHSTEYLNGLGEANKFTVESGKLVLRYGTDGVLTFLERLE